MSCKSGVVAGALSCVLSCVLVSLRIAPMPFFAHALYEASGPLVDIESDFQSLVRQHGCANAQWRFDDHVITITFEAPDDVTASQVMDVVDDKMQRMRYGIR